MADVPFKTYYLASNTADDAAIKADVIDMLERSRAGDVLFDSPEELRQALLELNDPNWSPTRVTTVKITLSIEE